VVNVLDEAEDDVLTVLAAKAFDTWMDENPDMAVPQIVEPNQALVCGSAEMARIGPALAAVKVPPSPASLSPFSPSLSLALPHLSPASSPPSRCLTDAAPSLILPVLGPLHPLSSPAPKPPPHASPIPQTFHRPRASFVPAVGHVVV